MRISRLADYSAGLLLVLLTLTVFTEVIFRYLLNMPIRFSAELAMIIFPWMIFLSSVTITWSDSHIGIVIFRHAQTGIRRKIVEAVIHLTMIAFSTIMLYAGWNLAWGLRGNVLAITGITKTVLYISVPLAFTLISLILLTRLARILLTAYDAEPDPPDGSVGHGSVEGEAQAAKPNDARSGKSAEKQGEAGR